MIGERDVANPAPSGIRAAPLPATKVAPETTSPTLGKLNDNRRAPSI